MIVNGVTLPDLPTDTFTQYPYAAIFSMEVYSSGNVASSGYVLLMASSVIGHIKKGVLTGDYAAYEVVGSMTAGLHYGISSASTSSNWGSPEEREAGSAMVPISEVASGNYTMEYALLWCNHDVLDITSINKETGEYRTGDVYFWKSGYENVTLPAVPSTLKNTYPSYGIVRRTTPIETLYFLVGAPTPGAYVTPEQISENYGALFCKSNSGYICYSFDVDADSDWALLENPSTGNGWCKVGTDGRHTFVITDANMDVYYASAFDAETEEVEYSSEIYFARNIFDESQESQVSRYSIAKAILDAVARQIMRLTDSTEKVKPEEFEAKLESVGKGMAVPDNAKLMYFGNAKSAFKASDFAFTSRAGSTLD